MRTTFKQLAVFARTAQYGNLSQAADSLNMSQSAASDALKTLESAYNLKLFERVGKRLKLNSVGEKALNAALSVIEAAEVFEHTIKVKEKALPLKVGATLSIGNYLAIDMLATFNQRHPEIDTELVIENTQKISERVVDYKIDIGLIEGEVNHPSLDVTPWRNDELVIFCSPKHPLATESKLTERDLIEATWVLRESGSGTRQAFDIAMHGILSQLNIGLELQHTEAIKRAVSNNMGLGCLSGITLAEEFARGELVPLNAPQRDFTRKFYFVTRKGKQLSRSTEEWKQHCAKWINHSL